MFKQLLFLFTVLMFVPVLAYSQATTSSISGTVVDQTGDPLPGATVLAVHEPSGTRYGASTQADGRYNLRGMRVGGPYTITVTFIGFEAAVEEGVELNLGVTSNISFELRETGTELGEVTVSALRSGTFGSDRTGAATSISRSSIDNLPTISRTIGDFTRLTPQASGSNFAGQDNRFNNITVDGSAFNNAFGLGGQPGDRTGVAPISIDALEQIQVNIAPFDVRQGSFAGAGINSVTRSGTNEYSGSLYYRYRDESFVGTRVGDNDFNPGEFQFKQVGLRLGGPIVRDRLFFFVSYEGESLTEPGTTFRANTGNESVGGNITRVQESDLNELSSFLSSNFGYDTGPFQGYDNRTPATRFLAKVDYNLNDRNKISLRYTHLDSQTDVLASNSSSLGFGGRRTNTNALNFRNTNYIILENIRSLVGEWNSNIGDNMSNNMIIGYTYQDESRDSRGDFFPLVDILQEGSTYTSFGFEPFTPNNELKYTTIQFQNNFSISAGSHYMTFGASAEYYESENIFFPGSQSAYVYDSLDDFYADANGFLDNPNRTESDVDLRRFQVRWSNQPGLDRPVQPLEVFSVGLYGQTEWSVTDNINLTLGLRADVPFFGETGFNNPEANGLTFRDEDNNPVQYRTDKLPDPNILWSPRVGFNWDVNGDRTTQVRGGTGIFSGPPPYVWISNQIGNNGVLTGFERLDETTQRPFNPDPNAYKPANVTGDPASSYELAFTDPDFRFPQIWRTNIAVDQQLPFGLAGTLEFLYGRDVNGIYYINANLADPDSRFAGVDDRPRWTSGNRIHQNIDNAIVLKNQNVGYTWDISASLERPMQDGLYGKVAYNYGEAKNTINPGSIAFGSWNNNPHIGDPNNPGRGFSSGSSYHRMFASLSYRNEFFSFGATTFSLFWEGRTIGNASYTFSGDINGDGGNSNDLIYIHNDISEMNFQTYESNGQTISAQDQAAAWDAFIEQDRYLSNNRGSYAERNGVRLPMVFRSDVSIAQEFFTDIFNQRNAIQFRLDILNVNNLISRNWGGGQRMTTTQPLIAAGADDNGVMTYRLARQGGEFISSTFDDTVNLADVFRMQFSIRYTFN